MAFRRLVVAYDASAQAEQALRFAFDLTAGSRPELTVAHVVETRDLASERSDLGFQIERLVEIEERDWRERLAPLGAHAPDGPSVAVEVLVEPRPAHALLKLAADRRADLVVAGTHRLGGFERLLLGSVSQHLLEQATCSVLLVREPLSTDRKRCVVAGIDGSDAGSAVVEAAQSAAAALSAELVLVYVVEPLLPAGMSAESRHAIRAWEREQAERALYAARMRVSAPLERVSEEVRDGRDRDELLAVCDERQPLLAVVGATGRHGFAGLMLGSTARLLANAASCPVLTVRGQDTRSPAA